MYALADCNNFFASCERVFRPELNGKPVIVLSNNDGCAVARSNEAKALGIKMGDPLFKIRDIVKKNDVAVFSGNFALYGDMSYCGFSSWTVNQEHQQDNWGVSGNCPESQTCICTVTYGKTKEDRRPVSG